MFFMMLNLSILTGLVMLFSMASKFPSWRLTMLVWGKSEVPGSRTIMWTPSSPVSSSRASVTASRPALEAAYTELRGSLVSAQGLEMLMTRDPGNSRNIGSSS